MYQSLLTRRYITSKIMPALAIICVLLSSALVLVAWSIMGGFLVMLLDVGRKIEGDVTINWPTSGFAHYDDLIARLEKDPLVSGAAPMIETFGMVTLPDDRAIGIKIKGIDERFTRVSDYEQQLWWKPVSTPEPRDRFRWDPRLSGNPIVTPNSLERSEVAMKYGAPQRLPTEMLENLFVEGKALARVDPRTGQIVGGVVPGIEVMGYSIRDPEGFYTPAPGIGRRTASGKMEYFDGFAPNQRITVRVIPMDSKGRDMSLFTSRTLPVVNEYRTGLFEADKNTMLMNLSELQRMLKMDQAERLEPAKRDPYAIEGEGDEERVPQRAVIGVDPARVTTVLVKGKEGVDAEVLRVRCIEIYRQFARDHLGQVPDESSAERMVSTWERSLATFISAVRNETTIVVGMLLFMSAVCAVLILAIFWSMVSEKTKDIGILRAVGASRAGVAWLWLRYGLIIGIVGGSLGLLLGAVTVWNINPIHEWMGARLGMQIWDPNVYYFPTIPNFVERNKAILVGLSAVICSVVGALIPALKAAYMDPVKALRFE